MNNEITINNKGQEVNQWGQVKYISPTGIVSWHFPCNLPTKAGYQKPEQTREHKRRISMMLREHAIWEYYDQLYVRWKALDMPSAWEFGKVARIEYEFVENVNRFRWENMVKNFRLDIEEELQLSMIQKNVENEMLKYGYDKDEIVEKTQPKTYNWWDDIDEEEDPEDTTFIGFYAR
ncbi:hypothetical protein Q9X96_003118 [Vibrio vulnificus]|nr:hypothetical protein [Vibrio vulnificus]